MADAKSNFFMLISFPADRNENEFCEPEIFIARVNLYGRISAGVGLKEGARLRLSNRLPHLSLRKFQKPSLRCAGPENSRLRRTIAEGGEGCVATHQDSPSAGEDPPAQSAVWLELS
jgi:hypothetical protein